MFWRINLREYVEFGRFTFVASDVGRFAKLIGSCWKEGWRRLHQGRKLIGHTLLDSGWKKQVFWQADFSKNLFCHRNRINFIKDWHHFLRYFLKGSKGGYWELRFLTGRSEDWARDFWFSLPLLLALPPFEIFLHLTFGWNFWFRHLSATHFWTSSSFVGLFSGVLSFPLKFQWIYMNSNSTLHFSCRDLSFLELEFRCPTSAHQFPLRRLIKRLVLLSWDHWELLFLQPVRFEATGFHQTRTLFLRHVSLSSPQ